MFAGESGVRDIRGGLVAHGFPVPFAGVVDSTGLPSHEDLGIPPEVGTRLVRYSLIAAGQALDGLGAGVPVDGIVFGTPGGVFFELAAQTFRQFDPVAFNWESTTAEAVVDHLARLVEHGRHGPVAPERRISINTACATGIHAVGVGLNRLRAGRWTRCLVGGVDSGAWESTLMNFHLLNALTTADVPAPEASRPFSRDRAGFVRSEAAAALLLETREAAEARGAPILAEVRGFSLTSDAYRLTDGREDNQSVVRAMEQAVVSAGLSFNQIDYISAHGTSTPQNDRLETLAIKKVFGSRAYGIPVSSLKSQIGHPTVASGAVETIACVLMLQRQRLAPTINLKVPDPECDLDYVTEGSRDAEVRYILNNAFGFGGQNACVVLGRAD